MVSTPNWRSTLCFSLTFLCTNFLANAQVPEVFSKLRIDHSCDSYLWVGSIDRVVPPNARDNVLVRSDQTQEMIFQMIRSRTDHCTDQLSFSQLNEKRRLTEQAHAATPFVIMEIDYWRFRKNALEEGWLKIQDGFVVSTDIENPFERQETIILDLGVNAIEGAKRWYWDSRFFISNLGSFPDEMRINFGDGWHSLRPGEELIQSAYSGGEVQLQLRRGEEWKNVRVMLKNDLCQSAFPDPHETPWAMENGDFPWQFSVDGMKANAYTLWSDDGIFDKPFIFVEGIDFEYDHYEKRNGRFGWCQFTGGNTNGQIEFQMLTHLPYLLNDLRAMGFDIIMLDFYDGAARIEDNSKLLQELISRCIAFRVGLEPIVVAGASMGGQVARHALRQMELDGVNHCTRLFISLDSPHQGAYIPAALQETIYELSEYVSAAAVMIDNKLMRPAARQMLQYQINQPLVASPSAELFVQWQLWKSQNGLPQRCRNVAIANGSSLGTALTAELTAPLIDYGCEFSGEIPLVNLRLYPLPGNTDHEASNEWETVIADILFTENLGLFNGTLTGINQYHLLPTVANDWPALDYAPGGTRESIKELVDSFNDNADFIAQCSEIETDEYNSQHCFVPTYSALDMTINNPQTPIQELLANNQELCPFDNWFIPEVNQQHVEVTANTIDWIESEVFAGLQPNGEPWLPVIFSGENYAFNFYSSTFHRLSSIVVSNQAQLMINNFTHGHYTDEPPFIQSTFQVELSSLCGAATATVMNDGAITVGDQNGLTKGVLIIEKDGFLRILGDGKCTVNRGSKIIVRNGGAIQIDFGGILNLAGGELFLEKGSKVYLDNGELNVDHTNGKIHFLGGVVYVGESLEWSPFASSESSHGQLIVYAEQDDDVVLAANAKFIIDGFGNYDESLLLEPFSHFNCRGEDGSKLMVSNVKVTMEPLSKWANNVPSSIINVAFLGNEENAELSFWGYATHLEKCQFNQVSTFLNNVSTMALKCKWQGESSGVNAIHGLYTFRNCHFYHCSMSSSWLDEASILEHCVFEGNYNQPFGFFDKGSPFISLESCEWNAYSTATRKMDGKLQSRCSKWTDNSIAIELNENSKWMASTESGGGYNLFEANATHVHFDNALAPDLSNGYNDFGPAGLAVFSGNISDMICQWNCGQMPLYAHYNNWHNQLGDINHLFTISVCSSNHPCAIKVIDFFETTETNCTTDTEYALQERSDVESVAESEGWQKKETATLFPNPANEWAEIKGIAPGDVIGAVIYTTNGQLYRTIAFNDDKSLSFSIHGIPAGVYVIKVECTNQVVPMCLVVE